MNIDIECGRRDDGFVVISNITHKCVVGILTLVEQS